MDIASIDIIWESTDNITPNGHPVSTVKHRLLNLIIVKREGNEKEIGVRDEEKIWKIIVVDHNIDHTSTHTK